MRGLTADERTLLRAACSDGVRPLTAGQHHVAEALTRDGRLAKQQHYISDRLFVTAWLPTALSELALRADAATLPASKAAL
jgi:hypothetical protein